MRILILFMFTAGFFAAQAQSTINPKIAPELRSAFSRGETPDILVVMSEQADLSPANSIKGKAAKANYAFQVLRTLAQKTQGNVREFLHKNGANANSFYIVNAISVKGCTAALAQELAYFTEVRAISADPWVEFPEPITSLMPEVPDRSATEWGINKINAPAVWALGYTGQGVTVGGADTGYDWTHPAIQPHYRGLATGGTINHNYNWHDAIFDKSPLNADSLNPCGFRIDHPCDDQSHGTHTMGTMTGDDGQGNQIGVAPGAKWVGCRNMERGWGQPSTYIECFEWFLAPTDLNGLNPQPAKAPDVINNSWYCAVDEGCTDLTINEMMRTAVINLKASGVVVVVSNGNFGGQGCNSTYGPPAYFEESFSVGSTQENDTISNFSSRGPVTIDGSNRVKPNVSAPGQFVRSSVLNGEYAFYSGTSMAGPHVVGLVALLLSANPSLKGEVAMVEEIVESTCLPINGLLDCSDNNGLDYPNNMYGFGRVDALQAVEKALTVSTNNGTVPAASVVAFPNPTTDQLFWSVQYFEGTLRLRLTDAQGRLMVEQKGISAKGQLLQTSMKGFSKGIYYWTITLDSGIVRSGKVVVE